MNLTPNSTQPCDEYRENYSLPFTKDKEYCVFAT